MTKVSKGLWYLKGGVRKWEHCFSFHSGILLGVETIGFPSTCIYGLKDQPRETYLLPNILSNFYILIFNYNWYSMLFYISWGSEDSFWDKFLFFAPLVSLMKVFLLTHCYPLLPQREGRDLSYRWFWGKGSTENAWLCFFHSTWECSPLAVQTEAFSSPVCQVDSTIYWRASCMEKSGYLSSAAQWLHVVHLMSPEVHN